MCQQIRPGACLRRHLESLALLSIASSLKIDADCTEAMPGMSNDSSDTEIPPLPQFISGVIACAREEANADLALLEILEKHIVKENSAATAVRDATKEIQQLAEKRVDAANATWKPNDAGSDND